MKIFIPEIGTKLILTQDWKFKLFSESRNEGAFARLHTSLIRPNYDDYKHTTKTKIMTVQGWKGAQYHHEYLSYTYELTPDGMLIPTNKENENWHHEPITKEFLDYYGDKQIPYFIDWCRDSVLPVGTVLTIDRIYIRKGANDYSSLSFWALLPGDKKRFRFWAKLHDVNEIICDIGKDTEKVNHLVEYNKNKKIA